MSIKNILLLTMLMAVGGYKAEIIRGIPIPNLNIKAAEGRWYGLATTNNNDDQTLCRMMSLVKGSGNHFTMYSTVIMSPEAKEKSYSIGYECRIMTNSNVFVCSESAEGETFWVMLDIEYDSYMAMYMAPAIEDLRYGNYGDVLLLGRDKETAAEAMAKYLFSNHYAEETMGDKKLNVIRTDACR